MPEIVDHGYNCCIVILTKRRTIFTVCKKKKKKKNTTNESRFFSANREEFQREKSEKGRVLSADVCTRCLWRDIITRNVSSVPKITKGGFLGKSKDDFVGDNKGRKIFFAIPVIVLNAMMTRLCFVALLLKLSRWIYGKILEKKFLVAVGNIREARTIYYSFIFIFHVCVCACGFKIDYKGQ